MTALVNHDVRLEVGGKAYSGWSSVDITRSLETVGWSFALELFQGRDADPIIIRPQSSCVVRVGRTPVITGYVDVVTVAIGTEQTSITVTGRSKTADIIDCHPDPDGPRRWSAIKLETLASVLCAEYGVEVATDAGTGAALERFALQTNETVYDAIERACGLRQLMLCDDQSGRLIITRASQEKLSGSLAYGVNLESVSCTFDGSERFSAYVCRGQRAAGPTIDADAAQLVAGSSSDGTSRTRRLVIQPDGRTDAGACKSRAEWEMLTRYGRSTSVSCTVPGWFDADGNVWEINRNIRVRVPQALIDDDLLLVSAQLTRDVTGTRSMLTLQPREAFAAYTPPARGRGRGKRTEKGLWLTDADVAAATARARSAR